MNFYKHHLGDYAAATAHLSWDEDCAYRRLLDAYYKREAPIPAEPKIAARLARASTAGQRAAVEVVLQEFFVLKDDGWHQKRCDEEIGSASAQADTNRRIAEQREANKRARLEAEAAERLAKAAHESSTKSLNGSSTNRSPEHMGEREPSQTPDSRLQTPDLKDSGAHSPAATPAETTVDGFTPTAAGLACRALKRAGLPPTSFSPSDPRLLELLKQGATPEEFEAIAREAVEKRILKPFGWVLTVIQARRAEAAVIALAPPAPVTTASREAEKTQAYLRAQRLSPEEKVAADAARERVMAQRRTA